MLLTFNVVAILATFAGGGLPLAQSLLSRKGMRRIFAVRAGILLSVAFTEVLPSALTQDPTLAGWGALAAFVLFFLAGNFAMVDSCPEYLEQCPVHALGWATLGALFVHSFLDGFNFAVSFSAGAVAGSAVGLALLLHKLADGFTLTSLLQQTGYSRRRSLLGLLIVALATPLGSLLSRLGISRPTPGVEALLLGCAGGSFIYIGAADVLPRLHKSYDRDALLFFGAGMLAMALIRTL